MKSPSKEYTAKKTLQGFSFILPLNNDNQDISFYDMQGEAKVNMQFLDCFTFQLFISAKKIVAGLVLIGSFSYHRKL